MNSHFVNNEAVYEASGKGDLKDLGDKAFYTQQNRRFERTITRVKAGIL